jgi:hypothetical protein
MRTPDGVTGFPPSLWARQTTEIRSTNRLAYLDAHATGQFERVMKSMGSDEITSVYFGEGPPDKYQTTGRIDSTDWSTGAAQNRRQRHRLHPPTGGLHRGQHHLARHLRADDIFLI